LAILAIFFSICGIVLILVNDAEGKSGDAILVEEAKLFTKGREITLQPGEILETDEGDQIQVVIKMAKDPDVNGILRVLSDLSNKEGRLQLDLSEYQHERTAVIKISGIVPSAQIEKDYKSRVGERTFNLINLIHESGGQAKTIFTANSISTTPQLKESRLKMDQLKKQLEARSLDERASLAMSLLETASIARSSGNPDLAIDICKHADEALNLNLMVVALPTWYLAVIFILASIIIFLGLMLIKQIKKQGIQGWIKTR